MPVELSGERAQDVGGWERRTARVNRRIGTRLRVAADLQDEGLPAVIDELDAAGQRRVVAPGPAMGERSRPVAASSRIGRRTTVLTAQIATGSRNSPAASGR